MYGKNTQQDRELISKMNAPGNITKLLIEGYSDPSATSGLMGSIEAVVNPESYTLDYTIQYQLSDELGAPAPTQIFTRMDTGNLQLELLADGTGVIPMTMTVDAYVEAVKNIAYDYQGTVHRPNYLKISWGNLTYICVCEKISVKYTLFNSSGQALRAVITLTLQESIAFATKIMEAQTSSPDLTHIRTVMAGDTLPLMTYRIYGDPAFYVEVARVNGLNSIHDIRPGDEIYFPPLKK